MSIDDAIGAFMRICIIQPTKAPGATQTTRRMAVVGCQRYGPKLGKTEATCAKEPVCRSTPAMPVSKAVRTATTNPTAPKIRPGTNPPLGIFLRYHQAIRPVVIAARTAKVMY